MANGVEKPVNTRGNVAPDHAVKCVQKVGFDFVFFIVGVQQRSVQIIKIIIASQFRQVHTAHHSEQSNEEASMIVKQGVALKAKVAETTRNCGLHKYLSVLTF
jgi:hypothetical protein